MGERADEKTYIISLNHCHFDFSDGEAGGNINNAKASELVLVNFYSSDYILHTLSFRLHPNSSCNP